MYSILRIIGLAGLTAYLVMNKDNLKLTSIEKTDFKTITEFEDFNKLTSKAKTVLVDLKMFCDKHKIPFLITETFTTKAEDEALNRQSNTHSTGRAFDFRTMTLNNLQIDLIVNYFNKQYINRHFGAIVNGKPLLCVDETNIVGRSPHLHFQVSW